MKKGKFIALILACTMLPLPAGAYGGSEDADAAPELYTTVTEKGESAPYDEDEVAELSEYGAELMAVASDDGVWAYNEKDDGTIEIAAYKGSDTELVIPSEINGKTVTSIGESAFERSSIINLHIPASVMSIGDDVFRWCYTLENITVSEENNAYTSVDGVLYSKDKTIIVQYPIGRDDKQYTILDGTQLIDKRAFDNSKLYKVVLPDTVTKIEYAAFYQSDNLTYINIPDNVKTIGIFALGYCNLKTIILSRNLEYLERGALMMSELESAVFNNPDTEFHENAFSDETVLYSYEKGKVEERANQYGFTFKQLSRPHYGIVSMPQEQGTISFKESTKEISIPVEINISAESEAATVRMYVAVYKDGVMTGIVPKDIVVNDEGSYNEEVIISDMENKPDCIKVFAFDIIDGMTPLCESSERTKTDIEIL